jgi:hypothetical protein
MRPPTIVPDFLFLMTGKTCGVTRITPKKLSLVLIYLQEIKKQKSIPCVVYQYIDPLFFCYYFADCIGYDDDRSTYTMSIQCHRDSRSGTV